MKLTIQPRIQKETWSLYWKESMNTETQCLEPYTLDVDSSMTVRELQADAAKRLGWQPVGELLRLEGFSDSWERSTHGGRELPPESSLQECGIPADAAITTVRKQLVAE
eukprot:evm.model.scf_3075.1 EVM.evm.TU.scf_3075.1   scf_3075:1507-2152(-)